MVSKAYLNAIAEFKLEPIAQPQLDAEETLDTEKPFNFKIKLEVLPEVTLGEYKGLEVEKKDVNIDDAQVDERLQSLRERNAEVVLSEKKILEKGDFAVIDFEGFVGGQPFTGGAAQAYSLEIGSGSFIPGFEDQLVGMEVGTEKEIAVTFPGDYQSEELAGKDATFKVALKEIKVKEYPELDDEFAKSVGKFENLDELKADLKTRMITTAEKDAESDFAQAAIDKAVENANVEVPETLIQQETEDLMHRFEHNLAYQGLNLEQYLSYFKKTKEEIENEFRPEAVKRVKTDLVLSNIAKKEQIIATEAELDEKVNELATRYQQKNVAKFRKDLESKGRLEDIRQAIILEKTADFVKENTKAVEK
jgi:trigger factor